MRPISAFVSPRLFEQLAEHGKTQTTCQPDQKPPESTSGQPCEFISQIEDGRVISLSMQTALF